MKLMDMTENSQKTYNEKLEVFNSMFCTATNTSESFDEKLRFINLVCYLTFVMKSKKPETYKTTKDVLMAIFDDNLEGTGLNDGFCIICDDMLYGVTTISNPGFKTIKDLIQEIKKLTSQWLPF